MFNPLRPGPKLSDFPNLIRAAPSMFRDLLQRKYHTFPFGTVTGGCLGFLYLLNPLDLIPEAIPLIGIVDDALVFGVFLALLSRDVKKYLLWKHPHEPSQSKKR